MTLLVLSSVSSPPWVPVVHVLFSTVSDRAAEALLHRPGGDGYDHLRLPARHRSPGHQQPLPDQVRTRRFGWPGACSQQCIKNLETGSRLSPFRANAAFQFLSLFVATNHIAGAGGLRACIWLTENTNLALVNFSPVEGRGKISGQRRY